MGISNVQLVRHFQAPPNAAAAAAMLRTPRAEPNDLQESPRRPSQWTDGQLREMSCMRPPPVTSYVLTAEAIIVDVCALWRRSW